MEDDYEFVNMSQQMHAPASEPLSVRSQADQQRNHGKVLHDPVHNTTRLGPLSVKIMDSPQFQRLRDLKQLGNCYYIFPGASHNRFEHSLGVARLASDLAQHYKRGQPELGLTYHDTTLVEIAGLCHDLGHGPFSHVFEFFLEREGVKDWSHEQMSVKLFESIVKDKDLLGNELSEQDVARVKDMILASSKDAPPESTGRQYLHEIVANGRNGLDVDKFDYLVRDGHCCGIQNCLNVQRLMLYSKVIDGEICFKRHSFQDVLNVYMARANMHRTVYGHRKTKAIDLMVMDILKAANPVLKITDKIWDPKKFVQLDDTILKRIEFYDVDELEGEKKESMLEAQALLLRLRNREMYRYCGDWQIPATLVKNGWKKPTEQEVFEFLPPGSEVKQEDIMLMTLSIDHTAGTTNPLKNVRFFAEWDSETAEYADPYHLSGFHYECYAENSLRAYCKKKDKDSEDVVREATDKYVKHHYGNSVQCSTPIKKTEERRAHSLTNGARKRKLLSVFEESDPEPKSHRTA